MAIEHELVQVNGVGDATLNKLVAVGINTIAQLAEADIKTIVETGLTSAQAGKIIAEANDVLREKPKDTEKPLCPACTSGDCAVIGCDNTKKCDHNCIERAIEIGKDGVKAIQDRMFADLKALEAKPKVTDKDKVAPSSSTPVLRMRTKRHKAPRHRKR
jgi:hypothetical protein